MGPLLKVEVLYLVRRIGTSYFYVAHVQLVPKASRGDLDGNYHRWSALDQLGASVGECRGSVFLLFVLTITFYFPA